MDVFLRTNGMGGGQFQNMALLIISALGALILGGIVMKAMLMGGG